MGGAAIDRHDRVHASADGGNCSACCRRAWARRWSAVHAWSHGWTAYSAARAASAPTRSPAFCCCTSSPGLRRWRRAHAAPCAGMDPHRSLAGAVREPRGRPGTGGGTAGQPAPGQGLQRHPRPRAGANSAASWQPPNDWPGDADAADWVRRLREAALKDEQGLALDEALRTVDSFASRKGAGMTPYRDNPDAVRALVRDAEVHRDVYTHPEIFALEMEHLFANTWVYVGHDSQVPNAGDYFTTTIGSQPVVMVRHEDGGVHVLYNRCPHKGTRVVNETCGNTGRFLRCPYHAWSFRTDGSLAAVPLPSGYEDVGFGESAAARGMTPVRHVHNYRGFVFAKMADGGPSFDGVFRRIVVQHRQHGRSFSRGPVRGGRRRAALHARLQLENAGGEPDRHLPSDGRPYVFGRHRCRFVEARRRADAEADGGGNLRPVHFGL